MTSEVETVTIPKIRYEQLLQDSRVLNALYAAGVDNWEWYGDALSEVYGDDDEESEEDIYGD